jgi:murein DD-endopeptidase MepM/ murein hydrolase activator NlpD
LCREPPAFGYSHFHTGVDLVAPMGTPVYAATADLEEYVI